jgi:CRISPR-associated endonuclease Cas1
MLERNGKVLATTGPVRPSDARLRRAQSLAHGSGIALRIAKELIHQKLIAQEQLVQTHFHNSKSAQLIVDARGHLASAKSSDEIRRWEAQGALAYWTAWHTLPITYPRADLVKVPEHWRVFGSRISPLTKSPRLAANPPNSMLNFLYAILECEARLALAQLGLDPGIGVLHNDLKNRDSLACDLMEPIRPHVDAFLLDWLRRGPIRREWFFEERDGNCRLSSSLAGELSETSRTWKNLLAPFAEGIARAFWSVDSKPGRNHLPPTRLTQNRKREAKGLPPTQLSEVRAQPPIICRICGFAIKPGFKYCRKCVPTISRENILKAARLGRLNTHNPAAQARRSETQRRQHAARSAWRPTDKPIWMNEEYYLQKIQPGLAAVQVPTIQKALSISEPYALRIRSGKCIPHVRHWLSLAQLVGF